MSEIETFLQQIRVTEELAGACTEESGKAPRPWSHDGHRRVHTRGGERLVVEADSFVAAAHIARHDPAWALRWVAAVKRDPGRASADGWRAAKVRRVWVRQHRRRVVAAVALSYRARSHVRLPERGIMTGTANKIVTIRDLPRGIPAAIRCACDGRYDGCTHGRGGCDGRPGTPWGPHFCADCDPRRLAHISANLRTLREGAK